ncbi:dTDP-4-dehydrorhamnose reductase [Rheinheimera sp. UJ63]|uniref:dTDP-4-dehydrorhamnose reductase n=1 Tax=Rheinheimera sp. UJ63 TaxID=2910157 RepID=UPI001F3C9582|nr:dTDP-4-dehydrorhamnose reductase [Rheinheimera sp. UJ63]MCF4009268.1 dTDP-4-dehydrorhamnose reductase [Rheinheimera sp. UJ63]
MVITPNILLTGANGQLGKAIAAELLAANMAFVATNRDELDITNQAALSAFLHQLNPTIIINCAAYTAVDQAETDSASCFAVNELAVKALAEYCYKTECVLIHFSTDYVFDGTSSKPYEEQDKPKPLNQYGKSKLAGELAIQQIACRHYIIRTSWLYSYSGKNFYTTMQKLAQGSKPVKVVNDQLGAPTHAAHLAAEVVTIIQQHQSEQALPFGLYHYCDEQYQSWFEFAQQIFKAQQSTTELQPISSQEYAAAAARPANSCLNSQRLKQWLNTQTGQTALRYR